MLNSWRSSIEWRGGEDKTAYFLLSSLLPSRGKKWYLADYYNGPRLNYYSNNVYIFFYYIWLALMIVTFWKYNGPTVTGSGNLDRSMITVYVWHGIGNIDVEDICFYQDGTTSHTSHAPLDILREKFIGFIISLNGNVNLPSSSCDLTPIDFSQR